MKCSALTTGLIVCSLVMAGSAAPGQDRLRAGAAKINVTPPADAALRMSGYSGREEGHTGIRDSLYFRAIVLDNGTTSAAIVTGDISKITRTFWEMTVPRIERETGIPADHILLSATHTHAGPTLGDEDVWDHPGQKAYTEWVADQVLEVTRRANAVLQPARIGVGRGSVNVNINRRARLANGGWWLGLNRDGPSDKTLHVLKVESTRGEMIALLTNYAMHAVVQGGDNLMISADFPGQVSRYLEEHYGRGVVAPWTSGAAGDQAPIYRMRDNYSRRTQPLELFGELLGKEAVRVADAIEMTGNVVLKGAQTVVTCPGKKNPPGPIFRSDRDYRFLDADPVDIYLSVLMINNIAITGVSGEVLTMISRRLNEESPFRDTMMLTHCNGSSGYLADDDAYDQISYEIVVTRVKRGYAENTISRNIERGV